MPPKVIDDLCLELHYGRDLIESDVLLHLQAVLASAAPKMFASLEVHAYEWDRDRIVLAAQEPTNLRDAILEKGVERGATYDALVAESPPPSQEGRFGSVLLRGRGAGTGGCFVSVMFDTAVPARPMGSNWLWSNSIVMTISTARVEGQGRSSWLQAFAADLSRHADFLWGAAYLADEFASTNLDTTNGLEAIGRDIRRHLPGIFWLNLFGNSYRELIGAEALRTAISSEIEEDKDRVILRAFESPEDWPDSLAAKVELGRHLGDAVFFDRSNPARVTRAPDFGLPQLPEDPPFEVFTPDGHHFTPLPRLSD